MTKYERDPSRRYTRAELIAEWIEKFPEDAASPDLEQMALAGYCERPDGTLYWIGLSTQIFKIRSEPL